MLLYNGITFKKLEMQTIMSVMLKYVQVLDCRPQLMGRMEILRLTIIMITAPVFKNVLQFEKNKHVN